VFTATRSDKNLPDGWPVRVLAGLQALAVLHDGSLSVQAHQLTVTGSSGKPDAKDEISRILSDKLGPGEAFTIKVTYDKRFDPEANAPTPKQCLAAIRAALKAHKINFKPGSDTFTPDAAPTLDKIAEQVRLCPDLKLEIAGYTDSQGRPEMNLALSQSRAQAVLEALAARRVLVGNITARGYGEAHPIADNGTQAGREANRRIEITLQSAAPDAAQPATPDGKAAAAGAAAAPAAAAPTSAPGQGAGQAPAKPVLKPKPRPDSTN
jgi:OOP family OmpA-OmpF porin